MSTNFPRCSKCGGKVIREDKIYKCLNCSEVWSTNYDKNRFYEVNRQEIVKDTQQIGVPATRKKWKIPSSTLSLLLQKWSGTKPESVKPDLPDPRGDGFPGLPTFSDTWPETVQLKWLETYLAAIYILKKEV